MGLSVALMITAQGIDYSQFDEWELHPTKEQGDLWNAYYDPAKRYFVFAEVNGFTVLWDSELTVVGEFHTDRIDLPGVWHVAEVKQDDGLCDYRVFTDGKLVRHLCVGDGEVVDAGAPVIDESAFVSVGKARGDASAGEGEAAAGGVTVDGQALIENLPRELGVVAKTANPYEIMGQYYAYDIDEEAHGKKRGFFKRVFGRT